MSTIRTLRDALKEARIWLVGAGGATCQAVQNIDRALADTEAYAEQPPAKREGAELAVWEGAMPESNGKSNFTAVLHRKDSNNFDIFTEGFQFASSEYPDRVRYEADFMRWLIGERETKPELWDDCYDMDKHSGYVAPPAPASELPGLTLQEVKALAACYAYYESDEYKGIELRLQAIIAALKGTP